MSAGQASSAGAPPDASAPNVPSDDISCLAWAPGRDLLAAGAWNGGLHVWEVLTQSPGNTQVMPQGAFNPNGGEAPVLGCCFNGDGRLLYSCGCDNLVRARDLHTQQVVHSWSHDMPVRSVFELQEMGLVISGSWDRTVRFWSAQQPAAVLTLQLPERVYAMDVKFPLMVVGCADRHILVYDLKSVQQNPAPAKAASSSLKLQTRSVSCFTDRTGYAVGSIEGRCAIEHLEETRKEKNFTFRCHRTGEKTADEKIFAVNAIDFHPRLGTFATAGSDGTFVFWDKDSKRRLQGHNPSPPCPISAAKFSSGGNLFAYAVSYDWSRGHEADPITMQTRKLMVHQVQESEVKPKEPKK